MKHSATTKPVNDGPDMQPQYDFSHAQQGKYHERFKKMRLKVLIEPDVAQSYPTSAAVNSALRKATPGRTAQQRTRARAMSQKEREVLRILATNQSAAAVTAKLTSRQRTLEKLVEKLARYITQIESTPKGRTSQVRR